MFRLPRRGWPGLMLLLAACAGNPGPPPGMLSGGPDDDGPGGGVGGRVLNLFVSPAGQPFRATPGQPYPSAAWFAAADRDHDGRLTREEFRADAEAFFHSLDTDHDGQVDGFEIAAYEQSMPQMSPEIGPLRPGEGQNLRLGRQGFPDGDGGRRGGRGGGGGGSRRPGETRQGVALFSWFNDPEPVAAADTDFNSRISLDEARAVADRRFAMLDTLRRGYLALADLPKTPAQARIEAASEARRRNGPRGGVQNPRGQRAPPANPDGSANQTR